MMPSKREQQQGIVLVVALIMMAVIAVSSAAAIRNVITQDQIGQNLRRQSSARQSAEGMLRLCEAALASLAPSARQQQIRARLQDQSSPVGHWQNLGNWAVGGPRVYDLPADLNIAAPSTGRRPQCLMEATHMINGGGPGSSDPSSQVVVIVTARGFSPDYAETPQGAPTQGAQVWLQSTIQVSSALVAP
jgi:type IV pilus assembly protein PilX